MIILVFTDPIYLQEVLWPHNTAIYLTIPNDFFCQYRADSRDTVKIIRIHEIDLKRNSKDYALDNRNRSNCYGNRAVRIHGNPDITPAPRL